MIWHSSSATEIEKELHSDLDRGLEPEQVEANQKQYGKNQFTEKRKKTFIEKMFAQLKDAMVIILMIAAFISVVKTLLEQSNDWFEPIMIVAIVIFNAFLGAIQESKAENALEALKNLAAPTAKVIRGGQHLRVEATELTPGDVIELEAGDYIPADARLIETHSLRCDESMLTGESVASEKDAGVICEDIAAIGDRENMVFSGCSVAYGRGRAIVTEIGMNTEMGKIATMLKGTDDAITPLQLKLANLGKKLGIAALCICAVIFVIGFFKGSGDLTERFVEMLMTSVSLAVAAIPEGLPAIVTIVLAIGVQRMVKKNAIIRRLPAVETLGSASVICSDKTGTLTQNRMTLIKAYVGGKPVDVYEYVPQDVADALRLGALCCDGTVEMVDGKEKHTGDPTETAIVAAAMRVLKTDKQTLDHLYPRMCEIPFDSDRKLMTVVCILDGKPYAIVKGGADIIIDRCVNIDRKAVEKANTEMAKEALRVLGIAMKPLTEIPGNPTSDELEHGLTFVGLVGMMDPPRKEAKDAINECKTAGIRTIMITGDHVVTAAAIAEKLGIMTKGGIAVTGEELSQMDDDELADKLERICVYARVSPEDKIRIVQQWQKKGEVVAMTGDGVNDAPALKAADIGCAMGITGTDVAKGAAAMTLTDDNFATIVTAVKEGRGIFNNIRKAVHFLLSCNLGEILTVFLGIMLFDIAPLTPVLLLWTNLVTDSLPALALGMEPVEADVMQKKPRKKNESIFAHGLGINAIWQGFMLGILTLVAFVVGRQISYDYAVTMAFAVLSLSQLFHAMNCRAENSLFIAGWFKNKFMLLAFAISVGIVMALLFIPPVRSIFGLVALDVAHVEWILGLSVAPVVIVELVKLVQRLVGKLRSA